MIKGAIFDMDGLMFDSERLVYEIWQEMMDEQGFDYSLDIFKKTVGLRADKTRTFYEKLYGERFDYPSLKKRSRETFLSRVEKNGVPIKKGLFEILDFLRENGIKTAVATSTSAQTAKHIIKKAGVYDRFDAFVCGDDVKNGKPNPEVFLTAAKKIGVEPEHCAAFEDSINGIKAAFGAKMLTFMVPDLILPTDRVKPMINFLCKDLSQAVKILRKVI